MDVNDQIAPNIDKLLQDLKDVDLNISRDAMMSLVRSKDASAVEPLLDYLADKRRLGRSNVAFRLYRFTLNGRDSDLVLEALIRVMANDAWSVRYGAYWAFVGMSEARAIPAMIDLLKYVASGEEEVDDHGVKDDYSTYSMIAGIEEMCNRVGDPFLFNDAIEPLLYFLNDPREKARRNAERALSALGVNELFRCHKHQHG